MNETTIKIIGALLDLANAASYPNHATRKGAQEITAICHAAERHVADLVAADEAADEEEIDSE